MRAAALAPIAVALLAAPASAATCVVAVARDGQPTVEQRYPVQGDYGYYDCRLRCARRAASAPDGKVTCTIDGRDPETHPLRDAYERHRATHCAAFCADDSLIPFIEGAGDAAACQAKCTEYCGAPGVRQCHWGGTPL